ncbi:GntR family transcriptional regulator, partial [Amycolatopsis pretoriensis]|uniref:GntR family transcriptional regulator n=1 Tax=Amycolatopsis pretoriensis TaxID=218821 RepID=UPI003D15F70A
FLQLDVREAPPGGLADWLAGQLRAAVADGRLPVGGRLPASRVLAAELRVSRGVVTEARREVDPGRRRADRVEDLDPRQRRDHLGRRRDPHGVGGHHRRG